jgi:hypothetical protein
MQSNILHTEEERKEIRKEKRRDDRRGVDLPIILQGAVVGDLILIGKA